jgi:1-acyl-sn-glycerol-3-phosphate acyltransferase
LTLRRIRRAVALVFMLVLCIVRFFLMRLRGPMTLERRALWLQRTAQGILAGLNIHYTVTGQPASRGLVVSNHLSYLDVMLISAAMPCFFVAKIEIGGWPFFGKAARMGGTIFVDRSSLTSAMSVADQMAERLKVPVPTLLFPEGTTTDGVQMIRFHSRLIDPATSAGAPITAASIRYVTESGLEERELCWYGDEAFATHLLKVLGVADFTALIHFGEPKVYTDRRVAADQTYEEIAAWRAKSASNNTP